MAKHSHNETDDSLYLPFRSWDPHRTLCVSSSAGRKASSLVPAEAWSNHTHPDGPVKETALQHC